MKLEEVFEAAWKAVDNSGVPALVQEKAFEIACAQLLGDGSAADATKPKQQLSKQKRQSPPPSPDEAEAIDPSAFFHDLSDNTGVEVENLERILRFDGTKPEVVLRAPELGSNGKAQMVTTACLIAGARQFGMGERETPMTVIRKECERLRCLDRNINTYVKDELKGFIYTGSSHARVLQARAKAQQEFADAVRRLVNGE